MAATCAGLATCTIPPFFKDDDPILAIVRMREPPGTFLILSGRAVLDSCVDHDFAL
jgi:hypothetical protein